VLADGDTHISGFLAGEDCLSTARALEALGVRIERPQETEVLVHGVGAQGLRGPATALDMGNAGTAMRLFTGLLAPQRFNSTLIGDASLMRRPMERVLQPLSLFGATWESHETALLPLTLKGARSPIPIEYELPVASAQVKSALLLAALNAPGRTTIVERIPTRDHTERMLHAFGAGIRVEGNAISIVGEVELKPAHIAVPRDPSSAAFPLVAALIVPDSDVTIPGMMLNPGRTGLLTTLCEMGAKIAIENRRTAGGEDVGDVRARFSALKGVEVPPDRAPSMIDEYPILAIAAAFAEGRTTMRGVGELRVKESDRLAAIATGLRAIGVTATETKDSLVVEGRGGDVPGGGSIITDMDHRIAMSFLVAGLAARAVVAVDDATMIATSFPNFETLMKTLGAQMETTR